MAAAATTKSTASRATIFIGGAGSDDIECGDGEDLLVGGMTTYDKNTAMLIQLGFAWKAGTSAATRASDLQNAITPGIKLRRGTSLQSAPRSNEEAFTCV